MTERQVVTAIDTAAFFAGLADRRIVGSRCPTCARVLVPARVRCGECSVATTGCVDLEHIGWVDAYTVLAETRPGLPEPPVLMALVTLSGASNALLGAVTGIDLSDPDALVARLSLGTRVSVAFAAAPQGRITDFHFVAET